MYLVHFDLRLMKCDEASKKMVLSELIKRLRDTLLVYSVLLTFCKGKEKNHREDRKYRERIKIYL